MKLRVLNIKQSKLHEESLNYKFLKRLNRISLDSITLIGHIVSEYAKKTIYDNLMSLYGGGVVVIDNPK